MIPPRPPFKRLSFRWSARVGKFFPCADTDPRGTMVESVDALGRVVIEDHAGSVFGGHRRLSGYTLGHPSSMYDPEDGRRWLAAEAKRRRQKK
jgi:hypothetical protein